MTDFRVLSINSELKQILIDWGFVVLNHDIPLYILENPGLSPENMREHLSYMRPPEPVNLPVPETLLTLVDTQVD